MTKINLRKYAPLEEGTYSATLSNVKAIHDEFDLEELRYIDAIFIINGRTVSDRMFVNSSKFSNFADSLMPHVEEFDTDTMVNIPVTLDYALTISNGKEYASTSNWIWGSQDSDSNRKDSNDYDI